MWESGGVREMEAILNQILNEIRELKSGQERLEGKIDQIQKSVDRIELSQPEDIVAML